MSDTAKTDVTVTGQDPATLAPPIHLMRPPPKKSVSISTPSSALNDLGEEIAKEDDSLSPKIMSLIDEIDKNTGSFNPTIRAIYSKMVGLIRNDFWQIRSILYDSTKESAETFHLVLRSIVNTYQIATAKDVGAHLSDISTLRDDMATKAKEMEIQERNNKTFLESMTKSWNSLAKNMTSYNELLEKKILETSTLHSSSKAHLQATPKNTASSSTSRAETPQLIPCEGKTFKSKAGLVSFITDRTIKFNIGSSAYKTLRQLENIKVGLKIWKILLNFDLGELSSFLQDETCCLYNFSNLDNAEKLACIIQLQDVIPSKTNQWSEIGQ